MLGRERKEQGSRARIRREPYSCMIARNRMRFLRRRSPGESHLSSSSPCRSLSPIKAGRDRGVPRGHLGGVAGSDLEDIIKTFAKIKNGRACIALTRERNNSRNKEKTFIWPKGYKNGAGNLTRRF